MKCPYCGSECASGEEICIACWRRLPTEAQRLAPGTLLRGRYEITAERGKEGGQGNIYFAVDRMAEGKPCVVKQVKQPITSEDVLTKLQEEATRMAALSRAIGGRMAEILEDFVEEGHFYVVQQRIFGKTLEEIFDERRPLEEAEVVGWAIQCCKILRSIHEHEGNPVHRDISPDNLMLTKMGDIMFIDFGTLRELQRIVKGTAGMGKFGYAPPEQWGGKLIPQSDIFALGATIYFLLTGFLPLSSELKSGGDPRPSDYAPAFPPIREKRSEVSSELEQILSRALDLDADRRYQTAREMVTDLEKMAELLSAPLRIVECPKCGLPNEGNMVYCGKCLAILQPASQECPRCHRSIPANAAFCPKCGTRQAPPG